MAVLMKGYDPKFSIELKSKRTKDSRTFLNFDRSLTTIFYDDGKAVRKNATYYSIAADDGWVQGNGVVNSTANYMNTWYSPDSQYHRRSFVSFDTSGIPDAAVIISAYLRLRYESIDHANPILSIDYCLYGSLTSDDFNRAAEATAIATITGPASAGNWANSGTFTNVHKTSKSQYRLRAYGDNEDNNCDPNSSNSAYDPELHVTYETIPTAPSNCVSHYVATNNAKCTWNDNSNNETGFRIEKAIDGAGFSFWKNVGAGVTDSGTYTLGANHRIKFQVRAYNVAGASSYAASGYTYTTPAAPTGATTHYVATDNAKLTWTDASAYESGFKLQYAIGAGGWTDWKTVGAGVQDSGNYSPGANTRIKFRVCAYIGSLYSAYSEGSYVYTTPTIPSEIALSWLVQNETVRITWTDNSAYEQDFDIERDTDDAGFAHIVYDVASPYDDEAPSGGGHKYKYRVRARCPDGRLSGWNTSDYIYSYIIFEKTVTETIALSDTVSRVVSWHRTFTEMLSLTDTIKKAVSKTFSEIITLSDVLFKKILKTFTENITLTGTITKIKRNLFLLLKKLRDILDMEGH